MVFEHVDPMLRVKRSRASAPHRREPPGTGDALRMKSGHESETTRAGHNVRRVASVQFSAPHVDIRFEKLHTCSVSFCVAFYRVPVANSTLRLRLRKSGRSGITDLVRKSRRHETHWAKVVVTQDENPRSAAALDVNEGENLHHHV